MQSAAGERNHADFKKVVMEETWSNVCPAKAVNEADHKVMPNDTHTDGTHMAVSQEKLHVSTEQAVNSQTQERVKAQLNTDRCELNDGSHESVSVLITNHQELGQEEEDISTYVPGLEGQLRMDSGECGTHTELIEVKRNPSINRKSDTANCYEISENSDASAKNSETAAVLKNLDDLPLRPTDTTQLQKASDNYYTCVAEDERLPAEDITKVDARNEQLLQASVQCEKSTQPASAIEDSLLPVSNISIDDSSLELEELEEPETDHDTASTGPAEEHNG